MLLRNCVDLLLSKQIHLSRPILFFGSQTSWYSTSVVNTVYPPKRAMTAWSLYVREHLSKTRKENPNLSKTELFLKLSANWRNADNSTVEKYNQLALDAKEKYAKEKEIYDASPDRKAVISPKKAELEKKAQKKQLKDLGMPKRSPNAYILFSSDFVKKNLKGSFTVMDASKIASVWANMPANEKSKWIDMAAVKEKEYKQKLEQWEADMTQQGLLEIVHTKTKSKEK